jgi:hypothetical protein
MDASIQGSLNQINKSWSCFEHKGERMTKEQVIRILTSAKNKGYKSVYEIPDKDIEDVLNNYKNVKTEINNPKLF